MAVCFRAGRLIEGLDLNRKRWERSQRFSVFAARRSFSRRGDSCLDLQQASSAKSKTSLPGRSFRGTEPRFHSEASPVADSATFRDVFYSAPDALRLHAR